MMKKAASVLLVFLMMTALLVVPASAADLAEFPNLPKNVCVVDDAEMLSGETEDWLDGLNGTLQNECKGATIAVLTVQDTGALSTGDYATQAFNEWGVGDKDENNGVLVLLCRTSSKYSDGDYYVALGKGLDDTQLSSELKTMLNKKMEKPFSKGNYDEAVTDTVKAIEVSIRDQYGQGSFAHKLWMMCKTVWNIVWKVLFGIVAVVVTAIGVWSLLTEVRDVFCMIFCRGRRGKKKGGKSSYNSRYDSWSDHDSFSRGGGSFGGMGGGSSFGGGAGRG